MNKLRCIIADDEPVARKILREFIEQVPSLELSGQFENAMKTEAWLQEHQADVLFLDIEMPKLSGLQYLKSCTVQPLVIITTAYPEYALEGYELDVIDYLLKPIAFNRFLKAIQKAREYLSLSQTPSSDPLSPYIFVRSDKRIEKIGLHEISWIESTGNYVTIVTGQKKILAYLTLKSIEGQLPANEFIKVHQSFIVNFTKLETLEGNLLTINGREIPVSRPYKEALMKVIDDRLLKR